MPSNEGLSRDEEVELYAVLNLSRGASATEINERYRSLSLLFHPDKQRDPAAADAATEQFLKVQKSYQVLSDPFLREVYDVLGLEGLSINWPADLPSSGKDKIVEELERIKNEGRTEEIPELEQPINNTCSITVDATGQMYMHRHRLTELTTLQRLTGWQIVSQEMGHTIAKRLGQKTTVSFRTNGTVQGGRLGSIHYVGTVAHQFSPRFRGHTKIIYDTNTLATAFGGQYRDNYNTVNATCSLAPFTSGAPPMMDIAYARRLYPLKPQMAEIALHLHQIPSLSINYMSHETLTQDLIDANERGLPSVNGFKTFLFERRVGIRFNQIWPSLVASVSVHVMELATRVTAGGELGFGGLSGSIGAHYKHNGQELDLVTAISSGGLVFSITFMLWKQKFNIPIILSDSLDSYGALFSVVIPSSVAVLGYHFIIRPQRRALRIAQIRVARRVLEEDSDARKKRNIVIDLLKDSAHKVMSSEIAKGGLVIESAIYGVIDTEDGARDLAIDVTIPLQALVRNSRLHVPGGQSKSNLQGFSDPAPFTSKTLRIHYLFRGLPHFADVPDYIPVVLPLSEHRVQQC
ncbi:DnaJ-domain-containing protein [Coprinopsis marcescibilis]|uniref:DnaJ-domain-containing protein n=1 Tax=Coprinopsis marcescibilis TaxID=230819 RepID=A0A5C3KK55_COPMA|nr:DnaJ-domain-containing protein [Coprinopsis marcescibilis]